MPIVIVNLPSDGTSADVADYNAPINAILAVVNGHLAADNMEPGGLDWSVMSGSMSNVIPSGAMQDSGSLEKFRDESNISYIVSGLIWSTVSGLNGTMSSGIYYSLNGIRYSVGSIASRAFTASKDTYVSISPTGSISYQEVVNGAARPTLTTDYRWLAKVVTSGAAITSILDMRQTRVMVPGQNLYKFSAWCSSGKSITNTTLIVDFQTVLFDTNGDFNASTSTYTAPVSGYYQINTQVWMGSAGAGTTENCMIQLRKNGSTTNMPESERMNGSGDANRLLRPKISTLIQLNAGDTLQVAATFVGARDIAAGQADTWFNGYLVCEI